jgi:hypothetical protein
MDFDHHHHKLLLFKGNRGGGGSGGHSSLLVHEATASSCRGLCAEDVSGSRYMKRGRRGKRPSAVTVKATTTPLHQYGTLSGVPKT